MPELPDIVVYLNALKERIDGATLERVRLASPFLLRSVDPPLAEANGKKVVSLDRIGKRIVIGLDEELSLVLHLMIAGRLRWSDERGAKVPGKVGLAAFDFSTGTLLFTEASSKKRASLTLVRGQAALDEIHRGGLEPLTATRKQFEHALTVENHTLKRSLTDPRLFSGIGNAYSDEILHRARLSPVQLTQKMTKEQIDRLYEATKTTLKDWLDRLERERAGGWPEKVTAFRDGMAVHGRYRQKCPDCGGTVMRIRYAENETNYCPACQTGGKLLADRALSRLLHGDWPKTLDELEERKRERSQ